MKKNKINEKKKSRCFFSYKGRSSKAISSEEFSSLKKTSKKSTSSEEAKEKK